jgi:hypothetical protein
MNSSLLNGASRGDIEKVLIEHSSSHSVDQPGFASKSTGHRPSGLQERTLAIGAGGT